MNKKKEHKNTEEKKLLTISLLVSNRRDTIRKCMESIKPLLDSIPSELIAVDTGCTDGSIDIVREYTDQVVPFVWCNDFSAARNAGLERAQGEWFLYLDDDEWFEDVTELIEFFRSGEYTQYDVAWYIVRNYTNAEGTVYHESRASRMSKLTPGIHFVNKVHEHFSEAGSRIKTFSCYVHHYGYVYKNEEEEKKHSERNLSLLQQELQEKPDDLHLLVQLVKEYRAIKRFDEAKEVCEKTIARHEKKYLNPYIQYMMVSLPAIARWQGDADETERMVQTIKKRYPLGILSELACAVELILAVQPVKDYEDVLQKLLDYFKLYDLTKKKVNKQEEVADFAFYASEEIYFFMIQLGFDTACILKRYDLIKSLLDRVQKMPKGFANIKHWNGYIVLLCLNMPVYRTEMLQYVDFMQFQQGVMLCLKENWCETEQVLKQLEAVWETHYLLYWYYAKMLFEEKQILQSKTISTQMLLEYADTVIGYASLCYSKEMFAEENKRWLPRNCQFALYVKKAFEAKEQNNQGNWTEFIKLAAKVYSPMITVLQRVLKEEAKRIALDNISPEMRQLAEELKKNIRELIKVGAKGAAKELLIALEQYVPGDKEVRVLKGSLEKGI